MSMLFTPWSVGQVSKTSSIPTKKPHGWGHPWAARQEPEAAPALAAEAAPAEAAPQPWGRCAGNSH